MKFLTPLNFPSCLTGSLYNNSRVYPVAPTDGTGAYFTGKIRAKKRKAESFSHAPYYPRLDTQQIMAQYLQYVYKHAPLNPKRFNWGSQRPPLHESKDGFRLATIVRIIIKCPNYKLLFEDEKTKEAEIL